MCLRAALESGATHAVIVQDDAIVCKNFPLAVKRVIKAHPNVPICLFVSAMKTKTLRYYTRAIRADQRYTEVWFQDFLPVVAVIWPKTKIEEFFEWYATDPKLPGMPNPRSDDAVVGSWMKFTRQRVLATVPSLVEHPDDTTSVKWSAGSKVPSGTGNKTRRAFIYIGDRDPLELDWIGS